MSATDIKKNQFYICKLLDNAKNHAVVHYGAIFHALSISLPVKKVDTPEQVQVLAKNSADIAQEEWLTTTVSLKDLTRNAQLF